MYANLDRYEDDLAVLVFDDEQQLVVGRAALPEDARPGMTLRVSLVESPRRRGRAESAVPVTVVASREQAAGEWQRLIALDDGQQLTLRSSHSPVRRDGQGWLLFEVDSVESSRRRAYARSLVERLFGPDATGPRRSREDDV